ncbi:HEAT repeat domain-containing protein [Polycladomyces sp. WAk]|uniref:HEAT repeat domain-containing protein n=1 Tax=Polycladomyces zharkentensis TaxID=2807616 RepID=A0ABS2WM63_9BACL|nr:HEAT repeat domain-containing protein [Polycladomyces sp. WAk]MBN2910602.1 HEAT repeat domain-containing protein [Polycladomyces sp. WAk]
MLEKLDQINWKSLVHAYGSAEDVPGLIRDLTSLEENVRKNAWRSLYSNIWHQGTVCEAAARAVPFFIELLEYESVPDRHLILNYLFYLANGLTYFEQFDIDEKYDEAFQINDKVDWIKETRQAVRKGIPVYVKLLNHADPKIRSSAAFLLGEIGEQTEEVLQQLRALLQNEQDHMVKASVLLSLGDLGDRHSQTLAMMKAYIQEKYSLLALVSALAILQIDPRYNEAIQLLVNTLKKPDDTIIDLFSQLPWNYYYSGWGAILNSFKYLPRTEVLPYIPDLVEAFRNSDSGELLYFEVLLHIVFTMQEEKLTVKDLTKEQRLVLQAIAECESIWIYAGTKLSLKEYGLPYFEKREELIDFLSG